MDPWRQTPAGIELAVLVVPGSSRDRVVGRHGDRLRLAVRAPPEDGRANRAVEELLAAWLGVRRTVVLTGQAHRQKTVLAPGLQALPEACARLLA
jgi:uncharacterized protein (TIGR00251 family)